MRFNAAVPALLGLATLSGAMWHALGRPAGVAVASAHQADPAHTGPPADATGLRPGAGLHAGSHAGMTDAEMERWAEAWWASHPRVGAMSAQAPAATFGVSNFMFDLDNNSATQVDTAKIMVGESVLWQWISGTHTITNGSGSEDPGAGTIFDQPSDISHQQFTFTFNTAGTFPFFCQFHEFANMKGVVRVSTPTGVEPSAGRVHGFTSGPSPNPTRAGVSFAFTLREPGRARAEVFDARGRRVAMVLDRDLEAGPHVGAWDGRAGSGARAGAGFYYLRLTLPGYTGSRAVVVAR